MPEAKRTELDYDERAAEARSILNSPIFVEAIEALKQQYFYGLSVSEVGTPPAIAVHAKLRVLDEVVNDLKSVITDQKMQKRVRHGN